MRRMLISSVCVAVCLSMATAPALAANPKCKNVNVQFVAGLYMEAPNCVYDGTSYPFCLQVPMVGTLNGTYYFYFPSLTNFVDAVDPWPGLHSGLAAGWGIGRYVTQHGEILTRDSWVVDLEDIDDFDFFSQVSYVVGGTGVWQGASGHIVQWGSDTAGIGSGRGEVCTPN